MGEIADMMLDGTLCQDCGGFIGEGDGFPRSCGCGQRVSRAVKRAGQGKGGKSKGKKLAKVAEKVPCGICGKKVKAGQGLQDHLRVVHGADTPPDLRSPDSLTILKGALHDLIASEGLYACDNEEGHSIFRLEHTSTEKLSALINALEVSNG